MTHDRNRQLRAALARLEAGSFAEAARLVEPVYLAKRSDPEALLLLGLAVAGCGHPDLAADLLDEAAGQSPASVHPARDLVRLLTAAGRPDAVETYFAAALALAPDDARLLAAAAAWRLESGDVAGAWPLLLRAERLAPELPAVQLGLASVQAERGDIAGAVDRLRMLNAQGRAGPVALGNLAAMLGVQGQFAEALRLFDQATRSVPADVQLAVNHGIALLKAGQLASGWPVFNRRLELPGHRLLPSSSLLPALAEGCRLDGSTVLVSHDSGFGDTLQFARYLPMLADRGARVLVWVPDALVRLTKSLPGVTQVVSDQGAWPPFDWHCPIIRLAEVFGTTPDTIPARVPYVQADPALAARWAVQLPPRRDGVRRVGIAWAGSARAGTPLLAAVDRRRSIDPALLLPLSAAPHVEWVSLQIGQAPPPFVSVDPMEGVADFADTAAIVSTLDAVVSVDTSVAHLAGAMGMPVMLLDRYDNCWRWLSGRTDSPWYPSLRIFRQPSWGDWATPVAGVADALGEVRMQAPVRYGRHFA